MLIMRLRPEAEPPPALGLLRINASASTKSSSAVGTERVPNLSLIRLMWMPLREPSERSARTRKSASPRRPGSAPSGRASVTIACASMLEQNHFEPFSAHVSPLAVAAVSLLARSEPPRISVMNIAPSQEPSYSGDCRRGSTRSRTSSGAKRSTSDSTPPVMPVAQTMPVSDWLRRYVKADPRTGGTGRPPLRTAPDPSSQMSRLLAMASGWCATRLTSLPHSS